jgi:hypothetical protein
VRIGRVAGPRSHVLGAVAVVGALVAVAPAGAIEAKPFGIASFTVQATRTREVPYGPGIPGYGFVNEPYAFTQAGGHPDALTSTLQFTSEEAGASHTLIPTRDPMNMVIGLPPGLSADPQTSRLCTLAQATESGSGCPSDTQVGVFVLRFGGAQAVLGPIVGLTPEAGQPAELMLEVPVGEKMTVLPLWGRVVRTARGYGLAVVGDGLPELEVLSVETTLWGVPADAVHDPQRGRFCTASDVNEQWSCRGGDTSADVTPAPFLSMPADCSAGPQTAVAWVDSWQEPGRYAQAQTTLPGVTGCDLLRFDPQFKLEPDTLLGDAPVGLGLSIGISQTGSAQAATTPPPRDVTGTLAQGLSISPAGAKGLRACRTTGPEAIGLPTGLLANGEALQPDEAGEGEELGPDGLARLAPGHCPEASTVGVAEAITPLLAKPLTGRVYLAAPGCGGPGLGSCTEEDALDGNLYRLYVELGGVGESQDQGVNVKLEAKIEANPATGQLTMKIRGSPQLPVSRLALHLTGGSRALLDSPALCGPATTTMDLTPWSAPGTTPEGLLAPGTPDAAPSSFYDVTGCAATPSLHPGLLAGTVSPRAGAFSAFTLTVTRDDREQYLSAIQAHIPPGLLVMLASVPLCEEALASEGNCPQASRIGATMVAAGAGSSPLEMPGSVYLTGPYKGAPFGLSIVTPAIAGPFNLGLVVIRARIDIDSRTAALTIASDPLPQIVLGIPLRLRRITLDVNRPNFIFNPTNCRAQQITATVTGMTGASTSSSGQPAVTQGAAAAVPSPFAVGGCRALAFKPALSASVSGRPGAAGASLDVKLAFPHPGPGGKGANLARVKLALPKQLAPRLTSLQQSCEDGVFADNPADCPRASVVGIARSRTPVLPGELAGPVYLVSHGAAAFPSLAVVLQGDGVRLDLNGSTAIDRRGIASVAFRQVPDVPVRSFEAHLPQGAHSALGANADLCALSRVVVVKRTVVTHAHGHTIRSTVRVRERAPHSTLVRTALLAQNGAVLNRPTVLVVKGCSTTGSKR